MLMGNIGVISGVYDPRLPSRIRWDEKVEFPRNGELEVRALGMAAANGELFFSAGRSLFQRHDGAEPAYSEILKLSDPHDAKLNVEMGGIRGLSAIDTPGGDGQSLIFMWAPHGRSQAGFRPSTGRRGDRTRRDRAAQSDPMAGDFPCLQSR